MKVKSEVDFTLAVTNVCSTVGGWVPCKLKVGPGGETDEEQILLGVVSFENMVGLDFRSRILHSLANIRMWSSTTKIQ